MRNEVTGVEADLTRGWTLGEETSALELFMKDIKKGNKRLKKMTLRMYEETDKEEVKILCLEIYNAPDPAKYIRFGYQRAIEFTSLLNGFLKEGAHGVILTGRMGRDVYPVKVDCPESWLTEDDPWSEEDEREILRDCIFAWMDEHGKGRFRGKAVLFPYFGFSGVARAFDLKKEDK